MQSQPSSQSSSIKQVVVLLPSSRRVPFTGSSKVKFDYVGDFVETATGEFVIIPFGERLGETLVWLVSGTGTGTGVGVGSGSGIGTESGTEGILVGAFGAFGAFTAVGALGSDFPDFNLLARLLVVSLLPS